MIPLAIMLFVALFLIIGKARLYSAKIKQPSFIGEEKSISKLQENFKNFSQENCYFALFQTFLNQQNSALIESKIAAKIKFYEKEMIKNLWILETIVTAAPLLGLLGTIIGMSSSFKIIGLAQGQINPSMVTAGVAESLVATAFGLVIAVICLFAFNFFSHKQDLSIDDMESFANHLIHSLIPGQK